MLHILFIFLSLSSSSLCAPETNISKQTSVKALLVIPNCKYKNEIESYCNRIFIENRNEQIKTLIKIINKCNVVSKINIFSNTNTMFKIDIYAAIIQWALRNNYTATPHFIKQIPGKILTHHYSKTNTPFKDYLLKKMLWYKNNESVALLLPHFTLTELIKKDANECNYLDYAIKYNNSDAAYILNNYITEITQHTKFTNSIMMGVGITSTVILAGGCLLLYGMFMVSIQATAMMLGAGIKATTEVGLPVLGKMMFGHW